jgi:hypothetical protein
MVLAAGLVWVIVWVLVPRFRLIHFLTPLRGMLSFAHFVTIP